MKSNLIFVLFIALLTIGCDSGPRFTGEINLYFNSTSGQEDSYKAAIVSRLEKLKIKNYQINPIQNGFNIQMRNVKDTTKVIRVMTSNNQVGFWETYELSEVYPMMDKLNNKWAAFKMGKSEEEYSDAPADTVVKDTLSFSEAFPLWSILQLNIVQGDNSSQYLQKGSMIGWANISDTSHIGAMLKFGQQKFLFPLDLVFMWGYPESDTTDLVALY